jgi:CBS domain-containing protein
VQATDVMTRDVVTVGPVTSAKSAAEVLVARGFAALPVLDDDGRLVGVVAEADVLRDRVPADPLLHLRRGGPAPVAPGRLVRDTMTRAVRTVHPAADIADVARLLVDAHLRSLPVVEDGVLVGIVGRRDVLRVLVRPDEEIRADVRRLVEDYTGEPGGFEVTVADGATAVRRLHGAPQVSVGVEELALQRLATTVPGVVSVQVVGHTDGHATGSAS